MIKVIFLEELLIGEDHPVLLEGQLYYW